MEFKQFSLNKDVDVKESSLVNTKGLPLAEASPEFIKRVGRPETIYTREQVYRNRALTDPFDFSSLTPVWSPNSQYIAYVVYGSGVQHSLVVVNANNINNYYILAVSSSGEAYYYDTVPSWTPDSLKVVLGRRGGSDVSFNSDVLIGDLTTFYFPANLTPTNSTLGREAYPAVSPDGTKIAFSKYTSATAVYTIWVMNIDGTSPVQLSTSASGQNHFYPMWSPDGQYIYFIRDVYPNNQVWRVDLLGNQSQVTTSTLMKEAFIISPDGTKLAMMARGEGASGVYRTVVYDIGTGTENVISEINRDVYPTGWSPDSTKLLVLDALAGDNEIFIYSVDGLVQDKLTSIQDGYANSFSGATWSPDGNKIAFIGFNNSTFQGKVYTIDAFKSDEVITTIKYPYHGTVFKYKGLIKYVTASRGAMTAIPAVPVMSDDVRFGMYDRIIQEGDSLSDITGNNLKDLVDFPEGEEYLLNLSFIEGDSDILINSAGTGNGFLTGLDMESPSRVSEFNRFGVKCSLNSWLEVAENVAIYPGTEFTISMILVPAAWTYNQLIFKGSYNTGPVSIDYWITDNGDVYFYMPFDLEESEWITLRAIGVFNDDNWYDNWYDITGMSLSFSKERDQVILVRNQDTFFMEVMSGTIEVSEFTGFQQSPEHPWIIGNYVEIDDPESNGAGSEYPVILGIAFIDRAMTGKELRDLHYRISLIDSGSFSGGDA